MEKGQRQNLFDHLMPERQAKLKAQGPLDSSGMPALRQSSEIMIDIKNKEEGQLDRLKELDAQISAAINKVKALKEEKIVLEQRVKDLEALLNEKDQEVARLSTDKAVIKSQIEELLEELETLEVG